MAAAVGESPTQKTGRLPLEPFANVLYNWRKTFSREGAKCRNPHIFEGWFYPGAR